MPKRLLSAVFLLLTAAMAALFALGTPVRAEEPVELVIAGVEGQMLDNVRAVLSLPPRILVEEQVDHVWLDRFVRQVPNKVGPALEPFGYYHSRSQAWLETDGDNRHLLHVTIEPGEPVRVSEVAVQLAGAGADHPILLELVRSFPLRRGDILHHETYEKAKGALQARALDLGFIAADYGRREVRVARASRTADIDLELVTGPLYQFGAARISGAQPYPENFLRRFLAFREGEDFTYAKLGQTQLNFLHSDRFREIVVTPVLAEAIGSRVPVDIQLVTKPSRRLRPGVGYGTDTGPRFSLRYKDVNSFDLGHELGADLLLAELKQNVEASYTVPNLANLDSHTRFRLGYERDVNDTFTTASTFAEVERVRGFGRGRIGSVYLRLMQEDYTIADQDETSRTLLPGLRYSRRRFNDPVRPREGHSYSLEVRGTHQTLGSDTGLLQGLVGANALLPLPGKLLLLLRAQGGLTLQDEPLRTVPPTLRFFAGGDQSVRGYPYQSLGPRDTTGKVVGGKNLAVGSVELERALSRNWSVALFYDLGNAFNDPTELEWAQGTGLGIRRHTVVGPLKIDLARQVGVSKPAFRLHLSIGFTW